MLKAIWFVPPAIVTIAERRGLFARYAVDVLSARTQSSDEQFEALTEGRCDVAITAMDNVIGWNRRGRGNDFKIVAQIEATTPLSLTARADVESIAELAGRNLLVDSAENGFVVPLRAMLAEAGIDFAATRLTRAGGVKERFECLLRGEGDATLLGPPFDELALRAGLRCLARVNEAYPAFPGQAIVAREVTLERIGDAAVKWLRALDEARTFGRSDPAGAYRDLAATNLPALAIDAMVAGIGDTLVPSRAGLDLLVAQRKLLGLPGAPSSYSTLVDTRLLEQLNKPASQALAGQKGN